MNHTYFMQRCLELAARGRGYTGGNPLVGAVLVREQQVLAEGWYKGTGTDHAERNMFKKLDQEIQPTDRLYVNLEPCNHHGNTPPCTEAIIERGVQHVIVGMVDPDNRVSGQGIAALQTAGVTVIGPVCRAECERLNRGFVSLRTKGRPHITLKTARAKDGSVAGATGSRLHITSSTQDEWSHTFLRTTHDAILVGVGTVLSDDPALTIRLNKNIDQTFPQPYRIILDPNLRVPLDAKVVGERTIVITKDSEESEDVKEAKERQLKTRGAQIIAVPMVDNHFDWAALWKALSTIHYPLSTILVEGGPTTWTTFRQAGLVDEEVTLIG